MKFIKFSEYIIPANDIEIIKFDEYDQSDDSYSVYMRLNSEPPDFIYEHWHFIPHQTQSIEQAKKDAQKRFDELLEMLNG